MKNIKSIKGIILVMLLTFTTSCGDQFLNEQPMSFLSPQNTFVDAKGLQTLIDAALRGVWDQNDRDVGELEFNSQMSDVCVMSATDKPDGFADLRSYATPQNSRNNDAGRARSAYADTYIHIKDCNTVIDYIDLVEWTDGVNNVERNHLLGSAYFLRAWYYMQLTMEFGNVAFPLNVVTTARQDFKAFNMQGIWDQMITDLEWAVQHVKTVDQLAKGQAPNGAVRILLAKYYLLNLRYTDAEAQMNTLIGSGNYKLFTDADLDVTTVQIGNEKHVYNDTIIAGKPAIVPADAINRLHEAANAQRAQNPEGIWVLTNVFGIDGNIGRASRVRGWGPNFVSTKGGIQSPLGGPGTDVRQGTGSMMMKWGRGQGFMRPSNYSQYDVWKGVQSVSETDWQDYRHSKNNWFEMSNVLYDHPDFMKTPEGRAIAMTPIHLYKDATLPYSARVASSNLLCQDTIRCWYGYPIYKMWAYDNQQTFRQNGGRTDLYVYRLAEAYLIRAEAKFWQDNISGATADLNIIRERANAKVLYTTADVQTLGIGAILDERVRELLGEEYRHDEVVRISVMLAKNGKSCYNGKTYSFSGTDMEKSLSANNFYYDRVIEKNNFFRDEVAWWTYSTTKYTMDPKHIFWPIYEPYIIGNVKNVLNQTTGYDGSERNVEPLTHIVQPAGLPNVDPMVAIGEREP